MGRARITSLAAGIAAAALLAVPAATSDVSADQVNDVEGGVSLGCGSSGLPLFQGFVPSRRLLAAVRLRLRAGGSYPASGLSFPVRIRRGSPSGDVVGSAVAVSPPGLAIGAVTPVDAPFAPPLVLDPEGTYVIEGASVTDSVLSWVGAYGNPYGAATAFVCNGGAEADLDLSFVSFTPSDGSDPETAFMRAPTADSLTRARTTTFAFSGTDDLTYGSKLTFVCALDGQAPTPCGTPLSTPPLGDGRHSLSVAARDQSGRTDQSPATVSWTIDTIPPSRVTVTGPRRTRLARPTYRFAATHAGTAPTSIRYRCALDSERLVACGSSFSPRLRVGPHVLRVAAVDPAGNRGALASVRVSRLR